MLVFSWVISLCCVFISHSDLIDEAAWINYSRYAPIHFNKPFCRLDDLNGGVGDLLSVLAMAIVLLQPASHRATIVVELRRSLLKAVGSWPLGGFEICKLIKVGGNDIAVNEWDSHSIPHQNCWSTIFLLEVTGKKMWVSYLELLGLSSHADWIHHGDKDGYVTQRASHAACYTDTQRIIGTFNELNCSGILMLWSCKETSMLKVMGPRPHFIYFLWLPNSYALWINTSTEDTYHLDSCLACQGHREGFQSLNKTERPPWSCLFHSSEIKTVSVPLFSRTRWGRFLFNSHDSVPDYSGKVFFQSGRDLPWTFPLPFL